MKKTISFILALVMMLCMASTALAADVQTTLTLTVESPFTYTLNVPATLNLNEAAYVDSERLSYDFNNTISTTSTELLAHHPSYREGVYIFKVGENYYRLNVTATCEGLKSGTKTIESGIYTGGTNYYGTSFTQTAWFNSDGSMFPNAANFRYYVNRSSMIDAEPGDYTDTITWTVTSEKETR